VAEPLGEVCGEPVAKGGALTLNDAAAFEAGLLFKVVAAALGHGEQAPVELAQRLPQRHVQPRQAQRKSLLRLAFCAWRKGDGIRSRSAVWRGSACVHG